MTLKQIIKQHTWLNIQPKLMELYPEEEGNLPEYEQVYEKLLFMAPVSSNIMLHLTHQTDDFDGRVYVDVSGKDLNPDPDMPFYTDSCAIEYTPWDQWLGMEITEETRNRFTTLEILCHSLYEMTFVAFDEEIIRDEIQRIQDIKDAHMNMREEEKRQNSHSGNGVLDEKDKKDE